MAEDYDVDATLRAVRQERQQLLDRIAFLEERQTELQASNTALLERTRNAENPVNSPLYVAASNLYKIDWVWRYRQDGDQELIGSKFWIELRDALGLKAQQYGNKWTIDQQRVAMKVSEAMNPTKGRTLRPGVYTAGAGGLHGTVMRNG